MMRLLKQIFVTFFTAVLTVMFVYGGYTIYAEGETRIDFRTAGSYLTAFSGYHGEMNDLFNAKIEKLIELVSEPDFYQNAEKKKLFLPPYNLLDQDDIPTILQKCGEQNLSSYCLSIEALSRYSDYLKRLDYLQKNPDFNFSQMPSASQLSAILKQRAQLTIQESQEAKAVMEATVSAYNEFRLAYPMHIKYQEILYQLTKYKSVLKDIRLRAAEFPVRFVDASTSQCQ